MSKDYEYFADFFKNPASFNNFEFHEKLGEWIEYMKEHAGEFNYLEDEEWRERRERVIEDIGRREVIREEFEDLTATLEAHQKYGDDEKIINLELWLAFMKNYRFEYGFTNEQIAETEAQLDKFICSVEAVRVTQEKARIAEIEEREAVAELDEALAVHYEKTGKIPVITTLKSRKKPTGN